MEPLLLQEGATFDTWNSFQTASDEYLKACHVQFCCVNSRTVLAANKLLTSNSTQYSTSVKYTYIRLWCKHFGNPRKSGHEERFGVENESEVWGGEVEMVVRQDVVSMLCQDFSH